MAKKIYDLCVAVGKYQKDGQEKTRYENIGTVLQKDDGGKFIVLKRTFNPAGVPNPDNKDSILVSLFGEKHNDPAPQTPQKSLNNSEHFDDTNIPW